ncbi:MAG: Phosphotransferase enzyme family protein [Candidatus Nitrotoga sp. SPKER]|nr:MAG: Phosphotransferase enzyme family protein [Candidatus Nitrotoga sp. SPKER]
MHASSHMQNILDEYTGAVDCTILDAGLLQVDHCEFATVIRSILNGQVAEFARDHNAICYRVCLLGCKGTSSIAIVKVPRLGPQRTNDDATFAWEAKMLVMLPAAGIMDAPTLLARIGAAGSYFLFMTELAGKHPDPRIHPLSARQLYAVLDRLYVMDRLGFMHYDLKIANILIDGDQVGFIDFEFARFENCCNTVVPTTKAFCEDFNVSSNPFFLARSNVVNFEFRAFHRYLLELSTIQSAAAASALFRDWLRGKSAYHRQMADFFVELSEESVEQVAFAGGITTNKARGTLLAAATHESLLAVLFKHPCDGVAKVERSLIAFRYAIFERQVTEAKRLQRAILTAISHDAAHADTLPDAYRLAIIRVLDMAGRSIHPSETGQCQSTVQ